jgi:hypothetical protein
MNARYIKQGLLQKTMGIFPSAIQNRFAIFAWAVSVALWLGATLPAWAGHPYAEFIDTLAWDTREVLRKHGMPVEQRRDARGAILVKGNLWLWYTAVPGSYTIIVHRAHEIPQQAVLEIVKMCMDFYEQRGRKERFRIKMYRESDEEWRKSLFLGIGALAGVKPFFELTIGRKEQ